jgi:hypothetical protein
VGRGHCRRVYGLPHRPVLLLCGQYLVLYGSSLISECTRDNTWFLVLKAAGIRKLPFTDFFRNVKYIHAMVSGWSALRPGGWTPEKDPVTIVQEAGTGGWIPKITHHVGFMDSMERTIICDGKACSCFSCLVRAILRVT